MSKKWLYNHIRRYMGGPQAVGFVQESVRYLPRRDPARLGVPDRALYWSKAVIGGLYEIRWDRLG